jgi:hypothetical protein
MMDLIHGAIRKTVRLFTLKHFHAAMRTIESNPELVNPQAEWNLWEVIASQHQPSLFIYDEQGLVSERILEYALSPVSEDEFLKIYAKLPKDKQKHLDAVYQRWPGSSAILFKPVPRLKDIQVLKQMDWADFVDNHLIAFETTQLDERLKLVRKVTALRGVEPRTEPNSIQCTNGGSGKSEYYPVGGGECVGKATANALIGFAKSPNEIYPGIINKTDLPIAVDQIESQSAWQIVSYLFNALEKGVDTVASGAAKFEVPTKSPFHFLANPQEYGKQADPSKSFGSLMQHLSYNPHFGRRIGLICYGKDFQVLTKKPTQQVIDQWTECWRFFRAVEEYAHPEIESIMRAPEIRQWLNEVIPDYESQATVDASSIDDDYVRTFLNVHASAAQARVKGAALRGAIIESLPAIALRQTTTQDIIDRANDLLGAVIRLNLESIAKIAASWKQEQEEYGKLLFRTLPDYMRDIISAVELWRRQPDRKETQILLTDIPYKPEHYNYLSQCVSRLTKRKGQAVTDELEKIRKHFAIELTQKDKAWLVTLLTTEPQPLIQPIGTLFSNLSNFPIYPLQQERTV